MTLRFRVQIRTPFLALSFNAFLRDSSSARERLQVRYAVPKMERGIKDCGIIGTGLDTMGVVLGCDDSEVVGVGI